MKSIYLDNAATTPLDPRVIEAILPYLKDFYGNPSSTHSHGRQVRTAIEYARKQVAQLLNVTPGEIFFTSGGTEADNTILCSAIKSHKINRVITSPLEHHAVLHTLSALEGEGRISLEMVSVDQHGFIDLQHLEQLLKDQPKTLVALMHGNNEIGNLTDIKLVGAICQEHNAFFHSDAVQTVGHYRHDLKEISVQSIAASAHKFHGPKGIGFMYINKNNKLYPFIHGGAQERNMRGGTENVYGIVGLAKALEIAYQEMDHHKELIEGLKLRMIRKFEKAMPGVSFNGACADLKKSLYTVLNVSLPESDDHDMLLFNLDIHGISASGGSACSSGATKSSHVLEALQADSKRGHVRFSFSRFNTEEDINYTVDRVVSFYPITVN